MADMDDLTGYVKKLEGRIARDLAAARSAQELLIARMLVVVATVAIFLVVSMGWYVDLDVDDETLENASGWDVFAALSGSSEGVFVFGGYYSWLVTLAALVGGASVFQLTQRWVCVTLSTLLVLLALGHLLVAAPAEDDFTGEQLAGTWAAVVVLLFAAIMWGNLSRQLRSHSPV